MTGSINIDVSKKLKKLTYNTKGMDKVNIQGLVGDNFLEGITKVVASGNTLSVYINGMKKPLKFTNISDTSEIDIVAGLYSKNLQAFYDEVNSGSTKKWLSRPSATKVAGTVFDETIDLTSGDNKYVPTAKNAKKKVGVTVSAGGGDDTVIATDYNDKIMSGAGNDTITAGAGKNTIVIDGEGTKTINISKDSSNDTIVFKGKGVDAHVILSCDFDPNPETSDCLFRKEGNNLYIDKMVDEQNVAFVTIKDYFKYSSLNITAKKYDVATEYDLTDMITSLTVNGNAFKSSNIVGTNFNDFLSGGLKADKITTANGDDTIYGNGGNDRITINGKGDKDIYIGRNDGNDIILFDLDKVTVAEKINVDIIWNGEPDDTKYTTKNQDLIITNKYNASSGKKAVTQVITIKNYLGNTNKVNLKVGEYNVYDALKSASDAVATETKGTVFDDVLTGTDSADVIYGYSGNDKIVASKGNDKIYGGDGDDRYVYDGFTDYTTGQKASLGHDVIYNSSGSDTISLGGLTYNNSSWHTQANYLEPEIIFGTQKALGTYEVDLGSESCWWVKNGNDLILTSSFDWKDAGANTITLKNYFKYGKDGFGVKYVDNGADYENNKTDVLERINILDNALLRFDANIGTGGISDIKPNNFKGTFMNDWIMGSSKPDTLRGGDGNDIIYGHYANDYKGATKDKLYGDEGNDIIFASDSYIYGGTGNDTFIVSSNDGANIISDEQGYDTITLANGNYLTYFDVTLNKDGSYKTGDVYIKNITTDAYVSNLVVDAVSRRTITQSNKVFALDENGRPKEKTTGSGGVDYTYSGPVGDTVIAHYVSRPVFEVSDAYYEQIRTEGAKILEDFRDYDILDDDQNVIGYNKRYLDGYALAKYIKEYGTNGRDGYHIICTDWDFYVKDYQYDEHGYDTTAIDTMDSSAESSAPGYYQRYVYDTNSLFLPEGGYDDEKLVVRTTGEDSPSWGNGVYELTTSTVDVPVIRTILKGDLGVVIKNGTHAATAVETILVNREYDGTDPDFDTIAKEDNMRIGDYNQENIDTIAGNVASWLRNNNYTSVQDAINRCKDADKLKAMFDLFKNTYTWTEDVKYRVGSYADANSVYGGKVEGTAILTDGTLLGENSDSTYELTLKEETLENPNPDKARMSIISDYDGDDALVLDYNTDGYSFLFDVEIDSKGNLQNYSRDFFVKFSGEEGENTGVQILNGREKRHAIETVVMKDSEGNYKIEDDIDPSKVVFVYNQSTVDAVRQDVAGWLYNNGYVSVQDVLHSDDAADIASMMQVFGAMTNNS